LLRQVDGHAYLCDEVHALAVEHLGDIRRKVADLRRMERVMSDMAARCRGGKVPECPIIDALFEMRPLMTRAPGRGRRTTKAASSA
jgi:MerR family transcriptional regulator, mercuric resistance operon regulatory protein